MLEINVSTNGVRALDDVQSRLKNFRPALGEVGAYLERKAKLRFVKQQAPDGTKWAPLKPSTLLSKKTNTILRETGNLVNSIAFNVGADEVRIKPSAEYGIFHQTGTKNMVARPFMGFEPDDAANIQQIFEDHIGG